MAVSNGNLAHRHRTSSLEIATNQRNVGGGPFNRAVYGVPPSLLISETKNALGALGCHLAPRALSSG